MLLTVVPSHSCHSQRRFASCCSYSLLEDPFRLVHPLSCTEQEEQMRYYTRIRRSSAQDSNVAAF